MRVSIIGIIGSLGVFVYAGGYMLGIIHEFDVIYVWGFKWGYQCTVGWKYFWELVCIKV